MSRRQNFRNELKLDAQSKLVEVCAEVSAAVIGEDARVPSSAAREPGRLPDVTPPFGNTGGKVTTKEGSEGGVTGLTVDLDTIRGTFLIDNLARVKHFLVGFFGWGSKADRGLDWYRESYRWEAGLKLAWTRGRRDALVVIEGDGMAKLSLEGKMQLCDGLAGLGVKATRLDPCADDESKQLVDLVKIEEAANAGQYSGFKNDAVLKPKHRNGKLRGFTVAFGERGDRGGGRYVRAYDKELESKGAVICNRLEVEYSQGACLALWEDLANAANAGCPEEFVKILRQAIGGAIDFVDSTGAHRHADRFKRLPWWDKVLEVLGSGRYRGRGYIPPLQRRAEWAKRFVMGLLAKIVKVADEMGIEGRDVVLELIERRMKEAEVWFDQYKADVEQGLDKRDIAIDFSKLLDRELQDVSGLPF